MKLTQAQLTAAAKHFGAMGGRISRNQKEAAARSHTRAAEAKRRATRLANRNGPKTMPTQQTPQHTPWRYERSINGGIVTHALLSGSEDMPCVHVSKQTRGKSPNTEALFESLVALHNGAPELLADNTRLREQVAQLREVLQFCEKTFKGEHRWLSALDRVRSALSIPSSKRQSRKGARSTGTKLKRFIARLKLERAKIAPFLRDLCPHCGGECRSILEGGIPAQYCEGCKTRFV